MGLEAQREIDRLWIHARNIELPSARRRRAGTDEVYRAALVDVRADIAEIRRRAMAPDHDGTTVEEEVIEACVQFSLELASLLFGAGAPHSQWRWWASRAAAALLRAENAESASVWAVLARDHALTARLPKPSRPTTRTTTRPTTRPFTRSGEVVWRLATGVGSKQHSASHTESVDAAWAALLHSIPAGDVSITERALRTLTDFWLEEDEDWSLFHPRSYPDFEPELNAVAALAQRSGWEPVGWPADALRFLEPGLAPETSPS